MLKKWLILAGCFFGGILLCGLGAGICFSEMSQFTYVGDREMGTMVEETLSYTADEDADYYYIYIPYDNTGKADIVSDDSLPEDKIEIDIKYNDDYEKPILHSWIYEEVEEPEETEDIASDSALSWHLTQTEETIAEAETEEAAESDESKIECGLNIYFPTDGVKIFMKYKDIILEDLKNKQIGTYGDHAPDYFEITVRCHPSMMENVAFRN